MSEQSSKLGAERFNWDSTFFFNLKTENILLMKLNLKWQISLRLFKNQTEDLHTVLESDKHDEDQQSTDFENELFNQFKGF